MPAQRRADDGFTLIELMIVVVVIGILAAIAIPKFNNMSKNAKEAEAPPILKQISTLQQRYSQKYDTFATDINDLEGGSGIVASGKYYTFGVAAHATGYCASAVPNAAGTAAGVSAQSIDGNHQLHESSSC
jgi:type IV pilus assembly protein PilE